MEPTTLTGYLQKITLEEDRRTHQAEIDNEALYKQEAFESNEARAEAMERRTYKRRVQVRAYATLRHRELKHGETYEEEKTILTDQMVTEDVQAVEEGLAQTQGWWNN